MFLYESPDSGNCYKVRLVMAHLGLTCERRTLSVTDRSDRPEVLGALNPALRVPTLVLDDGRPLAESNAITWYLAESSWLVPDDRYARARVLQWMFFEQYEHEPALAVLRFMVAISGTPEAFADRIPERTQDSYRVLGIMEGSLTGRQFLVGDELTLADITLYAYTHVAPQGGLDLDGFPAVRAWLGRVSAYPGHVPMTD